MSNGLTGRNIGRYQVLELIGKGGMATVFKAYDPRLEREVAVKVLHRDVFPTDEKQSLLMRFELEAKSLAKLSHPNIVSVIDYGEVEGAPYLVMLYYSGGTLKDRLGKPIPWRDAIQQILPIARALEYVHDRNIINRDVKPSNILLGENGEPMLADFGLVKLREDTGITSSGEGLGTPYYTAPEQWNGEATAKSDLYSLGIVLYEMITGHRPFEADTPAQVLIKQANEPLPLPKTYVPDLPYDVESVLLKALAKEPFHRYADMHIFTRELENLLTGKEVTATAVHVEQLREQMTGKHKDEPAETLVSTAPVITPPSPPPPTPSFVPSTPPVRPTGKQRNLALPAVMIVLLGGTAILVGMIGCWLLYTKSGLFPVKPDVTPVVQIELPPTVTPSLPIDAPPTDIAQPDETSSPPMDAGFADEITDDKGIPMRLVPAGEFTMGSDDKKQPASQPAHTLYLDAFYIDTFEVTNEMYTACVEDSACRQPRQPGSITRPTYYNNPNFVDYPVLYVDFQMAKAYCAWRDARLPTEAEWEKAARGADGRIYPWESQERNCFYSNLSGCEEDTTPVDFHEQGISPYGIYDLSGNVWEWTSTLYQPYPYDPDDGREEQISTEKRVLRGGAWHSFGTKAGPALSYSRLEMDPYYFGAYVGLRCAKDAGAE